MPREAIAYLCAFKCGRHASLNRKAVLKHETTCALNPGRRSCKTCAYNVLERAEEAEFVRDTLVYPGRPGGFSCEIDALPADQQMAVNCEFWCGMNRAPGL